MAYNITADSLPKDSGNRYSWAPYDAAASAYRLPQAYPVSGAFGGLAMGHITNAVADVMTATGAISSGVDLGGYEYVSLYIPPFGSGTQITFQGSGSGFGWTNIKNLQGAAISATGELATAGLLNALTLNTVRGIQYVRLSAANNQTATRTAVWILLS